MQEFQASFDLLAMLATDPRTSVLIVLLVMAAISDWRSFRIPNWLTFGGAVFALMCHAALARTPLSGLGLALGGLAFGLAIMLPAYMLGVMGAGDVKLMAMAGAFLGFSATLHAVLWVFIAGGVAALAFALWKRSLGRMLSNTREATEQLVLASMAGVRPGKSLASGQSIGKLPYGVCIAIGTIASVVARQLGIA